MLSEQAAGLPPALWGQAPRAPQATCQVCGAHLHLTRGCLRSRDLMSWAHVLSSSGPSVLYNLIMGATYWVCP